MGRKTRFKAVSFHHSFWVHTGETHRVQRNGQVIVPCIASGQPADLLYLHDWPRPCGGAAVMVDVVSSSLCILPFLPSRWQALCGQGVTSCRGRLTRCEQRAKTANQYRLICTQTRRRNIVMSFFTRFCTEGV